MPSVFTLSGPRTKRSRSIGLGHPASDRLSCSVASQHPVSLRRAKIDRQGYDENGRYWGVGAPLFHAEVDSDTEWSQQFIRAPNRHSAKARLRKLCPNIRFKR